LSGDLAVLLMVIIAGDYRSLESDAGVKKEELLLLTTYIYCNRWTTRDCVENIVAEF
jgi:hypothetical protein